MFVKSRLAVATVVMSLLFSVLLWRVFSLQVVNGQEYQDNSILRIIKERTLNSTRGNIYDRNGNRLDTMNLLTPSRLRTTVLTVRQIRKMPR